VIRFYGRSPDSVNWFFHGIDISAVNGLGAIVKVNGWLETEEGAGPSEEKPGPED
jgi:hypothetical protein